MFNVNDLSGVNSYKTAANAVAAVEKKFGPQNEGARWFNVLMVNNAEGRFVPVIMNVSNGMYGTVAHAGFAVVN